MRLLLALSAVLLCATHVGAATLSCVTTTQDIRTTGRWTITGCPNLGSVRLESSDIEVIVTDCYVRGAFRISADSTSYSDITLRVINTTLGLHVGSAFSMNGDVRAATIEFINASLGDGVARNANPLAIVQMSISAFAEMKDTDISFRGCRANMLGLLGAVGLVYVNQGAVWRGTNITVEDLTGTIESQARDAVAIGFNDGPTQFRDNVVAVRRSSLALKSPKTAAVLAVRDGVTAEACSVEFTDVSFQFDNSDLRAAAILNASAFNNFNFFMNNITVLGDAKLNQAVVHGDASEFTNATLSIDGCTLPAVKTPEVNITLVQSGVLMLDAASRLDNCTVSVTNVSGVQRAQSVRVAGFEANFTNSTVRVTDVDLQAESGTTRVIAVSEAGYVADAMFVAERVMLDINCTLAMTAHPLHAPIAFKTSNTLLRSTLRTTDVNLTLATQYGAERLVSLVRTSLEESTVEIKRCVVRATSSGSSNAGAFVSMELSHLRWSSITIEDVDMAATFSDRRNNYLTLAISSGSVRDCVYTVRRANVSFTNVNDTAGFLRVIGFFVPVNHTNCTVEDVVAELRGRVQTVFLRSTFGAQNSVFRLANVSATITGRDRYTALADFSLSGMTTNVDVSATDVMLHATGRESRLFVLQQATDVRFLCARCNATLLRDPTTTTANLFLVDGATVQTSSIVVEDSMLRLRSDTTSSVSVALASGTWVTGNNISIARSRMELVGAGSVSLSAAHASQGGGGHRFAIAESTATVESTMGGGARGFSNGDSWYNTSIVLTDFRVACVVFCGTWFAGLSADAGNSFEMTRVKFIGFGFSGDTSGDALCLFKCVFLAGTPVVAGQRCGFCSNAAPSVFDTNNCATNTTTVSRSHSHTRSLSLTSSRSGTHSRSLSVTRSHSLTTTRSPTNSGATATFSRTPTRSPSVTRVPTASRTISRTITLSRTSTPPPTATASRTPPPTLTATASLQWTGSATLLRTLTRSPSWATPTRSLSPSRRSDTQSASRGTATHTPAVSQSASQPATASASRMLSASPLPTASTTAVATASAQALVTTSTTASASHTQIPPPPPRPPAIPIQVQRAAEAVGATTSVAAGAASPGVALQVARSLDVLALVQYCELAGAQREAALAEPIGFPRSALPMLAVGDRVGQYHRGAIIANVLIAPIALFPAIILAGVGWVKAFPRLRPRSVRLAPEWLAGTVLSQALRATRLPGLLSVGYGILISGAASSAVVLATLPTVGALDAVLVIFGVLFAVLPILGFQWQAQRVAEGAGVAPMPCTIVRKATGRALFASAVGARPRAERAVRFLLLGETHWFPLAAERAGQRWYDVPSASHGGEIGNSVADTEDVNGPNEDGGAKAGFGARGGIEAHVAGLSALERHGLFFVRYRACGSRPVQLLLRHFFAVEAVAGLLTAVAQGFAVVSCLGAAWFTLAVNTLMFALTCGLRPYTVPVKNILAVIVSFITWTASAVAVSAMSDRGKGSLGSALASQSARLAAAASFVATLSIVLSVSRVALLRASNALLAPAASAVCGDADDDEDSIAMPMLRQHGAPAPNPDGGDDDGGEAPYDTRGVANASPGEGRRSSDFIDTGRERGPYRTAEGQQRYEEIERGLNERLAAPEDEADDVFDPFDAVVDAAVAGPVGDLDPDLLDNLLGDPVGPPLPPDPTLMPVDHAAPSLRSVDDDLDDLLLGDGADSAAPPAIVDI